MRIRVKYLLLPAAAIAAGCSGSSVEKPHRLSGEVFFDGKPIPFGDVLFTPNGAKGNRGPQGIADIRDGKYDTGASGKGIAGGPTVIRVAGFDRKGGKQLCEFEMEVDLPRSDSVHTIQVPKGGGVGPTSQP